MTTNTDTQHTAGPWAIELDDENGATDISLLVYGDQKGIAQVYDSWDDSDDNVSEGLANAHLIAAAPSLLAACEAALARVRHMSWGEVKQLSNAIAEAKGGAE
jgi:hypothetical protein